MTTLNMSILELDNVANKMGSVSFEQQTEENVNIFLHDISSVLIAAEDTKRTLKFAQELTNPAELEDNNSERNDILRQDSLTKCEIQKDSRQAIQIKTEPVEEIQDKFGENSFPTNPGDKRHYSENLPDRNPHFSGRRDILEEISLKLNNGISTICQRTTVTGLGGVGKSQTALEFAHIHRESYNLIRWINSDNISLHNSLLQFARDLNISVTDQLLEAVTKRIYKRLLHIPKWLLIFDNVEDHHTIKTFIPLTSSLQTNQHILITSQDQQWENEPVYLNVFSKDESVEFLKKCFECADDEQYLLGHALGNLPMALNHACAFIKQTPGLTISEYLKLLDSDFVDVISENLVGAEKSVMKTFLTTINKIRKIDHYAAQILYQCAMLSPNNIPVKLFYTGVHSKVEALKSLRLLKNYSMISSEEQTGVFNIHRLLQKVLIHSLSMNSKHDVFYVFTEILQHLIQIIKLVCPGEIINVDDANTVRLLVPHLFVLLQKLSKRMRNDDLFQKATDKKHSLWSDLEIEVHYLYFNALKEMGQLKAVRSGEKLLRKLEQRDAKTKTPETYADLLTEIGRVKYRLEENYEESAKYFLRAVCIYESNNGDGHISTVEPILGLSIARWFLGDRPGAMELSAKAMTIYETYNKQCTDGYADVLNSIGIAHKTNFKYTEALEMFQNSLKIKEQLNGTNSVKSIYPLRNIGDVLYKMGRYDKSLNYHKTVLEIREQTFGNRHLHCSYSLKAIAQVLKIQNKYDDAMNHQKRALQIIENALGKYHPHSVYSLNAIGIILREQKKYDNATQYHKRALEISEYALGKDHPDCACSLHNTGIVLKAQRKYDESIQYHKRALVIMENAAEENHSKCAYYVHSIGDVLKEQKKYDEAIQYHKRALQIRENSYDQDHPKCASSLHNIGNVLKEQGKHEDAMRYHRRALSIRQNVFGTDHPECAYSLQSMGSVLKEQRKYDDSIQHHKRALEIRENALGENHPDCAYSVNDIGIVLTEQRKYDESILCHKKALQIIENALGKDHSGYAISLLHIGVILRNQRRYTDAYHHYREALGIEEKVYGKDHPECADILYSMGAVLHKQGRYDEAMVIHQRVLSIRNQVNGERDPEYADVMMNIGCTLEGQGHREDAVQHHEKALDIYTACHGKSHISCSRVLYNLGHVFMDNDGCEKQAYKYLQQALNIRSKIWGENHIECGKTLHNMGLCKRRMDNNCEARALYERALNVYNVIGLEEDHPEVELTKRNLSILQYIMTLDR